MNKKSKINNLEVLMIIIIIIVTCYFIPVFLDMLIRLFLVGGLLYLIYWMLKGAK